MGSYAIGGTPLFIVIGALVMPILLLYPKMFCPNTG